VKKSSDCFGVTGPGECMMAFAAAEGAEVKTVVFMKGGALGGGISASNVPVDAERLVVGSGETETGATFCPDDLPVNKFCGSSGFEVEENGVPPLCADEADGGGGRPAAA
jgi:hypothetical protein